MVCSIPEEFFHGLRGARRGGDVNPVPHAQDLQAALPILLAQDLQRVLHLPGLHIEDRRQHRNGNRIGGDEQDALHERMQGKRFGG